MRQQRHLSIEDRSNYSRSGHHHAQGPKLWTYKRGQLNQTMLTVLGGYEHIIKWIVKSVGPAIAIAVLVFSLQGPRHSNASSETLIKGEK